jgi:hypothetical protein
VTECASCHGAGYAATLPDSGSTIAQVNAVLHLNGKLDGGGGGSGCIGCHATAQGSRRAIVPEFANAWSHKRSASPTGTVSNADCIVCHMEGDPATGNPVAGVHQNGVINLRDPDTGLNIKGVTFNAASGANPGSYTPTAADVAFTNFSRDLAVTLEADPDAATLQAIMINQCLKCHDANGAASPLARVSGGTAEKPFGTTIAGAAYTGVGVTANGVPGGVANVNESFKATNSSYHPVTGKQNNWYAKLTRMAAPWNTATRGGTVDVTSWGPLISCWDCHAPDGTPSTATLTATVTAHGGATTLRGTPTPPTVPPAAASTTNESTLCKICHQGYFTNAGTNHGAGSAFSNGGQGIMQTYLRYGCNMCHSSNYSVAVDRPVRAQDVHGVNALPAGGTKTAGSRWAGASLGTPALTDARPYAFIRNTNNLNNQSPKQVGATSYTNATCTMVNQGSGLGVSCSQGAQSYTAGGTY